MPKIQKLKNGGYVIEFSPPTVIESITDGNGTTAFIYIMEKDFKKLIDLGEQELLAKFIEDKERGEQAQWN